MLKTLIWLENKNVKTCSKFNKNMKNMHKTFNCESTKTRTKSDFTTGVTVPASESNVDVRYSETVEKY